MPSSGTRAYPVEDLVLGADAIFGVATQTAAQALFGGPGFYTLADAARAISAVLNAPVAVQGEPPFLGRWVVGDGVSTSFTITHGLSDLAPTVDLWDFSQSPPARIGASVTLSATDPLNTIIVTAEAWTDSPPPQGAIVVTVVGGSSAPPSTDAQFTNVAEARLVFGDGVSSSYTLQHGLGDQYPDVHVIDLADEDEENVTIQFQDANHVVVSADDWVANPPAANSLMLIARLSGLSPAPALIDAGALGSTFSLGMSAHELWLTGTLNADCVITVDDLTAGDRVILLLTQDSAGGHMLTVTDGVHPVTPAINSAANATSRAELNYDGTRLYG